MYQRHNLQYPLYDHTKQMYLVEEDGRIGLYAVIGGLITYFDNYDHIPVKLQQMIHDTMKSYCWKEIALKSMLDTFLMT